MSYSLLKRTNMYNPSILDPTWTASIVAVQMHKIGGICTTQISVEQVFKHLASHHGEQSEPRGVRWHHIL
jgi:hypothetical protein